MIKHKFLKVKGVIIIIFSLRMREPFQDQLSAEETPSNYEEKKQQLGNDTIKNK